MRALLIRRPLGAQLPAMRGATLLVLVVAVLRWLLR